MEKEKLFTIGQFAALHQINKKTLMWYDEVGLFKPAQIKGRGYRYYTYYQSRELETILMMRELEMSIPEIRSFLEHKSAETYLELLRQKTAELAQKIERLHKIQEGLAAQENLYVQIQKADLDRVEVVEKEEEYLYLVATDFGMSMETEIERIIDSTKEHQLESLHDTEYGAVISVENLKKKEFEQYSGLFMKMKERPQTECHVKPSGRYLQAYCKGEWDSLPGKYASILEYAEKHHLQLYGYSYEQGINEMLINEMSEYITKIEIPVKTGGDTI